MQNPAMTHLTRLAAAHKVTQTNSEQTVTMTLTKIEHNVPVDPKLFVKP
jgi:hypothetical protein